VLIAIANSEFYSDLSEMHVFVYAKVGSLKQRTHISVEKYSGVTNTISKKRIETLQKGLSKKVSGCPGNEKDRGLRNELGQRMERKNITSVVIICNGYKLGNQHYIKKRL
jgi:hypothetical protein